MSNDCTHGHTSYSEESYFYKETTRLVTALRRMSATLNANAPAPNTSAIVPAPQRLAA